MSFATDHTENYFLHLLSRGDHTAFEYLFKTYKDRLYSFILNLTGSQATAHDVVQEVFLKVWQNRETFAAAGNFGAYLFTAARNYAINGLRRNSRIHLIIAGSEGDQQDPHSLESLLSAKELKALIDQAIETLPPQQRRVFELSRSGGLKYEEIATTMGISVSTVRNHMIQALKTIREFVRSNYQFILLTGSFAWIGKIFFKIG